MINGYTEFISERNWKNFKKDIFVNEWMIKFIYSKRDFINFEN